jgi:TP901 family phage tail tape measure protein
MAVNLNVISQFDAKGLNRAQAELDKLAASTSTTSQKLMKGAAVAGAGILAGAGAVAVGLYQIGSQFDDAFDTIRVGTGATGPALEALQKDMKAVAGAVPASFADAGTAISELNTRLGLTGAPLQTLSSQVLELSRITNTDLGGNLEAVSSVMQNFGVGAGEQSGKLDLLFRASQASGVSVAELAGTMSGAGVVLRQVGLSFDQSAAFLATLAKAGVDAGDVMPALSKSLAVAAKNGKDASTVFNETFNAIKGAPDDVAASGIALDVFGAKAGPKLAAMIREGKLSFEEMQAAIAGGSETILGAGSDTQDFAEKLTMLKNRVFLAIEPIATRVFTKIGEVMDDLGPKVEQLTAWMTENKDVVIVAAGIIGGVAVLAIAAYTASMVSAAAATLAATWPILAVVAAIAAIVAAAWYVWNNWDKIWTWVKEHPALAVLAAIVAAPVVGFIALIAGLKYLWENWRWIWDAIRNFSMEAWNGYIKPVWDAIYDFIVTKLIPWMQTLWSIVQQAFSIISSAIANAWNNVIKPIWDAIYFFITNILIPYYQKLWDVAQTVWNAISTVITTAWGIISRAFNLIKSGIESVWGFFQTAKDIISTVFTGISNAITAPFEAAFNGIKNMWNNTIGGFSVTVPDWVKYTGVGALIAGKTFSIPKFAEGGVFNTATGGGSGLAVLHDNEMILNPQQQKALFSGNGLGGGPAINIVINTVAGDPDAIERVVIDAIARANRRGATVLVP